jgi:uncharacterized protein (DUF302 family)
MIRLQMPRGIARLTVVFLICLLPGLVWAQGAEPQMVEVVQSNKTFPDTLKTFKEEIGKAGWSVLNANNMAGVLSERGFMLHPVVILDVCSGQYSARILGNDEYRPISPFMPCRVSIYQTSDGRVFVARMNTSAFAGLMPPEVAEMMAASDREIDRVIAETVR